MALKQASAFRGSQISEQIAAEDVRQARAAFLSESRHRAEFYLHDAVAFADDDGGHNERKRNRRSERPPSFLGANAISEYQGLINASGEIDTSGRLKATLLRNRALLESARAGSEIARRDLIQAVTDAYFNLALSQRNEAARK